MATERYLGGPILYDLWHVPNFFSTDLSPARLCLRSSHASWNGPPRNSEEQKEKTTSVDKNDETCLFFLGGWTKMLF